MKKKLNILLIEDDSIEIMKLNRALLSLKMNHKIIEAHDGEDALNILINKKKYPDIILLDLNMPKINGVEFLSILKKNVLLKFIPIIILTTSNNKKDILECYNIGVSGYIIKPLKYNDYVSKIEKIISYWTINLLFKL